MDVIILARFYAFVGNGVRSSVDLIMSVHLFGGVVLLALPLTIPEITFLLCSPIRFASSALFDLVCFVFHPSPKPTFLVVVSVSFVFH